MSSKQLPNDKSKINIPDNLLKDVVLLKLHIGNELALVYCLDYKNSIKQMFLDRNKFRKTNEDPTFRRLNSLQQYLRKPNECKEISEEICQRVRPQNRRLAGAHSLAKIYQEFLNLAKFQPIVNTAETMHYHVGKYLSSLFNSLTINEYMIKDCFDAVTELN